MNDANKNIYRSVIEQVAREIICRGMKGQGTTHTCILPGPHKPIVVNGPAVLF